MSCRYEWQTVLLTPKVQRGDYILKRAGAEYVWERCAEPRGHKGDHRSLGNVTAKNTADAMSGERSE